ncbi:MAG: TIGR03960 family B12-binding radical SAM protein [Bacillota bacterium]
MKLLLHLHHILHSVEKPGRYLGNELNSIHKDHTAVAVRVALGFPDVYEVGMSHLGTQILYHLINQRPDALAERVFAPWVDMERLMRQEGLPLFTLESQKPVASFDILGFTLQYEMGYTNLLNMLDLAGIPWRSSDRGDDLPLVIAGGPCAFNPEPLAPFLDVVFLGEGEEGIGDLVTAFRDWAEQGRPGGKDGLLNVIAGIPGCYVPDFYHVDYHADGTIAAVQPKRDGLPAVVRKRVVKDLERVDYPVAPIVPYLNVVHDRAMLEVFRGCGRGCRFCQAGIIYRPVRERSPASLKQMGDRLLKATGHDELSLVSLSTADYSQIDGLIKDLVQVHYPQRVGVSLPSLRVDSFSVALAEQVQQVRKTGLTFAPEAGTQRLRDVINKNVTEADLLEAVGAAFARGWNRIKLYFMIGLPTETYADLDGIGDLVNKVLALWDDLRWKGKIGRRPVTVNVSAAAFVPKPHTPFQWEPQMDLAELTKRQRYLRDILRDRRVKFSWHDAELSFVEAVFARGDRRLAAVLEKACQKGCRFDGWSEHFHFADWLAAFQETGVDPNFYANRTRAFAEVFPWHHLSAGVSQDFLWSERERAYRGQTTLDCRTCCSGCGVCADLDADTVLAGAEVEHEQQNNGTKSVLLGSGHVVRLQIAKGEEARYISHLDFMRALERALRRARIPVSYSEGFNPHPRISYASALAVGVTSSAEYVDVRLAEAVSPHKVAADLNDQLPPGLRVIRAEVANAKQALMAMINAAGYKVTCHVTPALSQVELDEAVAGFWTQGELTVIRKKKDQQRQLDARPFLYQLAVQRTEEPGVLQMEMVVAVGKASAPRPGEVVRALAAYAGWQVSNVQVHRFGLYQRGDSGLKTPWQFS